jgi:FtsP/CotA-like multicopper oxidase with cupredoxin domain
MHRRSFLGLTATLPLFHVLGCSGDEDMPSPKADAQIDSAVGDGSTDALDADALDSDGAPLTNDLRPLTPLKNESTKAGTFEAKLVVKPTIQHVLGKHIEVWTYNELFPGPLIVVNEGDHVRIAVENQLPEETTIHWHGFPVPPSMDGQPTDPILPGATKIYEFDLPLGFAGTFWYHPHPHMRTGYQVAHGLAGMFIVKPKDDPIPVEYVEKHLLIEDLKLEADGTIAPIDRTDRLNGREGNHLVVNGQENPLLAIAPGEKQRWRIVNATSARFLRLAIPGHTLTHIATDGGLIEAPRKVAEVLIAPAERADVIVEGTGAAGTKVALQALPYNRGRMLGELISIQKDVLTLVYGTTPVTPPKELPAKLRTIVPYGPTTKTQRLVFAEVLTGGDFSMFINGKSYENGRIDIVSKLGELEEWEAYNSGNMDHPLHIHGTQFQVVSRELAGVVVPEPYVAWRDMAILHPGETVRLRIKQDFLGPRMVHCHILEHEDMGMMAVQDVQA